MRYSANRLNWIHQVLRQRTVTPDILNCIYTIFYREPPRSADGDAILLPNNNSEGEMLFIITESQSFQTLAWRTPQRLPTHAFPQKRLCLRYYVLPQCQTSLPCNGNTVHLMRANNQLFMFSIIHLLQYLLTDRILKGEYNSLTFVLYMEFLCAL